MLRRNRPRTGLSQESGQEGESTAGPLGAVTEERLVRCGGATLDDLLPRYPADHELLAVGRDQVHQPVTWAVGPDHVRMERIWPDNRAQRRRHFIGDLIALAVHGRPDEGVDAPVSAPCSCMERSAAPTAPAAVPRQPAWTAARTCASGSTRASGTQSATMITSVTLGVTVTRMSASVGRRRRSACRDRARRTRRESLVHREPGGQRPGFRAWCRTPWPPGPGWRRRPRVVPHVQAEIEGVVRWHRDAAMSCRHGYVDSETRRVGPADQWRERGIWHAPRPY